jgi:predicted kinase
MDQAIWASGTAPKDLRDWTYRAAEAVAEDNLRLGRDVVGDCVNDWTAARDGWQAAGERAGAMVVWVEIICSDAAEHRRRVETRVGDVAGLALPIGPRSARATTTPGTVRASRSTPPAETSRPASPKCWPTFDLSLPPNARAIAAGL